MIENERASRTERVIAVGRKMLTAARTAPKGKGVDIVECAIVTGDDIARLSAAMKQLHAETGKPVYTRDLPLGLNCAHCGFATCEEKPAVVPCAINSVDVGIAIGSAVATAADNRVDCRVMFSAGMAAERLNLLDGCRQYFCIPLSASSKNPFFDR